MLVFLISLFLGSEAHASFQDVHLKTGYFLSGTTGTSGNGPEDPRSLNIGISAGFHFRFEALEIGVVSHISHGMISNFYLSENGNLFSGRGTVSGQSFSLPLRRNLLPTAVISKKDIFYGFAGPSALFNTIRFRRIDAGSRLTANQKITSQNFGVALGAGVEQIPLKSERPSFVHLLYSVHWPKRYNVIDTTDRTQVVDLYGSNGGFYRTIHTIMVEAGIFVF